MTIDEYDALPDGSRYNVLAYLELTDPGPGARALRRHRIGPGVRLAVTEREVLERALATVPPEVTS